MLCGCSSEKRRHRKAVNSIERAKRLYPEMFQNDTIIIRDTVFSTSYRVDTINKLILKDTVTVVNNDRVTLKYFYTDSTIYHDVECHADTIIREIKYEQQKINLSNVPKKWYEKVGIWVIILLIILIFTILSIKFRKSV
jgi:hypothetical protein